MDNMIKGFPLVLGLVGMVLMGIGGMYNIDKWYGKATIAVIVLAYLGFLSYAFGKAL